MFNSWGGVTGPVQDGLAVVQPAPCIPSPPNMVVVFPVVKWFMYIPGLISGPTSDSGIRTMWNESLIVLYHICLFIVICLCTSYTCFQRHPVLLCNHQLPFVSSPNKDAVLCSELEIAGYICKYAVILFEIQIRWCVQSSLCAQNMTVLLSKYTCWCAYF